MEWYHSNVASVNSSDMGVVDLKDIVARYIVVNNICY